MKVKIVHASDLHGQFIKLPESDMYIFSGDILSNFGMTMDVVAEYEATAQTDWLRRKGKGFLRKFLGSPDAPVVVCRGNHDFIDLAPLFGGEVYEIQEPYETHNILGLEVGGFRGINYICGDWSDEIDPTEFYNIMRKVPSCLDIMVTHSPPHTILDGRFGEKWGINAFANWINNQLYSNERLPKLFCFGHIHNDRGMLTWDDGTIFSNAATTFNEIEIDNEI